jgi:hypothetical protein
MKRRRHCEASKWANWYRLSERQRERAVEAELNRPLTPAEFDDLQEEICEAMGVAEEEEIEDETDAGKPRLSLVWTNPHPPRRHF